jgi:cobalt/nickel transport protein
MKTINKLWILVAILALLAPIGLVLPAYFKAGAAWGEWAPEEIRDFLEYVPEGLKKFATVWNSLMPDYTFKGWEGKSLAELGVAYIISGVVGIVAIVGIIFLIGKVIGKNNGD